MNAEDAGRIGRIEAELAACERRFRAVFDSGFNFVLLLDADGLVTHMNRAAIRAFPGSEDKLRLAKAWDCLWWSTNQAPSTRLRAAVSLAATKSPVIYDDEFVAPDHAADATVILEISISRIADTDGVADQFVIEARDISRRRRSERAEHEVDTLNALGRIAAKVAHEINNPLAGIQYSFLLVKDAIPETHPQHKYVGAIEREIARIAAVTRQLYETYQAEPEVATMTSLANVVGDAVLFTQQVNPNSGVRVVSDLSRAPMLVAISGAVLRQVMYNLVQNAMDSAPEGSTVSIAVELRDKLEIRVIDSGPGVAPALRERIFEPFFSTKDKRQGASGMGLGLFLVRRSVRAAGGEVRVEPNPAGGAIFVVTLPIQPGT